MKASLLSVVPALLFAALTAPSLADGRTEKYRSNGCEIERKFDDDKYETKVECKPAYGRAGFGGAGKEEFRQGGCEIKREWKEDGEYKEEVKCK